MPVFFNLVSTWGGFASVPSLFEEQPAPPCNKSMRQSPAELCHRQKVPKTRSGRTFTHPRLQLPDSEVQSRATKALILWAKRQITMTALRHSDVWIVVGLAVPLLDYLAFCDLRTH